MSGIFDRDATSRVARGTRLDAMAVPMWIHALLVGVVAVLALSCDSPRPTPAKDATTSVRNVVKTYVHDLRQVPDECGGMGRCPW